MRHLTIPYMVAAKLSGAAFLFCIQSPQSLKKVLNYSKALLLFCSDKNNSESTCMNKPNRRYYLHGCSIVFSFLLILIASFCFQGCFERWSSDGCLYT